MNAFTSFDWRCNFIREFVLLWFSFLFSGAVSGMAGDAVACRGVAGAIIKLKKGTGAGAGAVVSEVNFTFLLRRS